MPANSGSMTRWNASFAVGWLKRRDLELVENTSQSSPASLTTCIEFEGG